MVSIKSLYNFKNFITKANEKTDEWKLLQNETFRGALNKGKKLKYIMWKLLQNERFGGVLNKGKKLKYIIWKLLQNKTFRGVLDEGKKKLKYIRLIL